MEIKATLDRFEEKLAVLKTEDNLEILWPIKKLPDDIAAGDSLTITLTSNKDGTAKQENLAKSMLNEILNVEDDDQKQ